MRRLILLSWMLLGCTVQARDTNLVDYAEFRTPTESFKTFRGNGISIKHPPDWKELPNKGQAAATFVPPSGMCSFQVMLNPATSLDDTIDGAIQVMGASQPMQLHVNQRAWFGPSEARYLECNSTAKGTNLKWALLVFNQDDKQVAVSFCSDVSRWSEYYPKVRQMLPSFQRTDRPQKKTATAPADPQRPEKRP